MLKSSEADINNKCENKLKFIIKEIKVGFTTDKQIIIKVIVLKCS
jgi:hypothetical protein